MHLMKKIVICFLFFPVFMYAQNEYVQMKNCSSLCLIPDSYSATGTSVLHILQNDGVGIYDNNINLVKTIGLNEQVFVFQSSRTRSRSVVGVERSSIVKVEDITRVYADFAVGQGRDFAALTHGEKQSVIMAYDKQFNSNVEMRAEDDFTIFVSKDYVGNNYFCYRTYQYKYPKNGVLLDTDGKVYRFKAEYSYNYSEWSDYTVHYDTIRSENNILACNYIGAQGVVSNRFYVSSTLFNEEETLEYVRPLYTLVDAPVFSFVTPDDPDEPVISEGEYTGKKLAVSGIEILAENGTVIDIISFGKEYDEVGNYQLLNGHVLSIGDGISVLQLGENRFISFDTVDDEEGVISVYKHFYKINAGASSVEAVNSPACIKVFQGGPQSIEVNYNADNDGVAELISVAGEKCASQRVYAGSGDFRMNVNRSGTYILTLSEDGTIVDSRKILIK